MALRVWPVGCLLIVGFSILLAAVPGDPMRDGRELYAKGDYEAAAEAFRQAVAADPEAVGEDAPGTMTALIRIANELKPCVHRRPTCALRRCLMTSLPQCAPWRSFLLPETPKANCD